MKQTPWQVAAMTPADLPGVLLIESQSPEPWNAKQLAEELACAGGVQLVCRGSSGVDLGGFLLARLLPGEAELLKIATDLTFRRQGVASNLLESFIAQAAARKISKIHLELRATNTAALTLYKKNAFEMTGRRRNYYTAPKDDALCMTFSVSSVQNSSISNP